MNPERSRPDVYGEEIQAQTHLINHVFVDYENVQEIDLAVIGGKAVGFTLLVGPRQTKLAVPLVEKLLEHATSVQLVRLASGGRNALDLTLAYYVGRAAAANPAGYFHIVSKDTGYDPLIEHLRGKQIRARRHDCFATLTFTGPSKLPARALLAAAQKARAQSKSKAQSPIRDERVGRVLEHLRRPTTPRPRSKKKLVSFLVTQIGNGISEADALRLVNNLCQAGHLAIDEKGRVTYHLERT